MPDYRASNERVKQNSDCTLTVHQIPLSAEAILWCVVTTTHQCLCMMLLVMCNLMYTSVITKGGKKRKKKENDIQTTRPAPTIKQ